MLPLGREAALKSGERFALKREQAPSPRVQRWLAVQLTDIKAILPPFFCPQISIILPAGNFVSGLKYMTQALD
ncbi:hypothetical protein [Pseudomonas sp. MPB03]|uniref:hypothetical protein n=1 Tax=Pseudomonas sp. MPB03 TaxID=3388489 RepID=UPI0039854828